MSNRRFLRSAALSFPSLLLVLACASDGDVNEWGKPTLEGTGYEDDPGAKADGLTGSQGLPTSVDSASSAVWEVSRDWDDLDPAPGMAWEANSGLTWDEKFSAWVDSMEPEGSSLLFTTPYGKSLPAPSLECAEVAIFLRIAFASWYGLPFFMEARDGGKRVYFGHFGIRTASGVWNGMPHFKTRYPDFSDQAEAVRAGAPWPSDPTLRNRKIPGGSGDAQPAIDADHAGAYFDEVFLNKRVGYYMTIQLSWMGSVNLADSANTWNLEPIGIRPGDVLVKRHNFDGIGHTYVVKEVSRPSPETRQVENMSGSMPRRQPRWDNVTQSNGVFTSSHAGGEGFEEYGGGLKRFRTAKEVGGRWTNVVNPEYADLFIPSWDHDRISGRHETFEEVLVDLSPRGRIDDLLEGIEDEREHLRNFPASCAARERREDLFDELYETAAELDMSREQVDRRHRELEDYVFAKLEYDQSKTCCWNSSTSEMYEAIMSYNECLVGAEDDPEQCGDIADGTCSEIMVFRARDDGGDGYEAFRQYAESQGVEWQPWSADESCSQSGVSEDTEASQSWTPLCEIEDAVIGSPFAPPPSL